MIYYTSGVFDMLHSGHIATFNKILNLMNKEDTLMIGVHSDEYASSFKRVPYQNLETRINNIRDALTNKYLPAVVVIPDPLRKVTDRYTEAFYETNRIDYHVQGSVFPENLDCYKVMTQKKRFITVGRSNNSTTEQVNLVQFTQLIRLGGKTNNNYKYGELLIKYLNDLTDYRKLDKIYEYLKNNNLAEVKHYQRQGKLIILNYISGDVCYGPNPNLINSALKEFRKLKVDITDTIFTSYNLNEEQSKLLIDKYPELFKNQVLCHGDALFDNVINHDGKGVFIDYEYACMGPRKLDEASYYSSLFLSGNMSFEELIKYTENDNELRMTVLFTWDLWKLWSEVYNEDYYVSAINNNFNNLSNLIKF